MIMKLSDPKIYRRLFASGFLVFAAGIILKSIYIAISGMILIILSKYGMRKEHREKLRSGEIKR